MALGNEKLFQAISIIVDDALRKDTKTMTIKGKIEQKIERTDSYKINYQNTSIVASSMGQAYVPGDEVFVLLPNGVLQTEKFILGKTNNRVPSIVFDSEGLSPETLQMLQEINDKIKDIISDGVIYPSEKLVLKTQWELIKKSYKEVNEQYLPYKDEIDIEPLRKSYEPLSVIMEEILLDMTTESNIDPQLITNTMEEYLREDNLIRVRIAEELRKELVYKIEIISTNGNIFKNGIVETKLRAHIQQGKKNVTTSINAQNIRWNKLNLDGTIDTSWEKSGHEISIRTNDVDKKQTFICTLTVERATVAQEMITIIDVEDISQITVNLEPNLPTTQNLRTADNQLSPDYKKNNLVIKAITKQAGKAVLPKEVTRKWSLDGVAISNSAVYQIDDEKGSLTIKDNILTKDKRTGIIKCEASYKDVESEIILNEFEVIDLALTIDGAKGDKGEDGKDSIPQKAWAWSPDGSDRFTTKYPNENMVLNTYNGKENERPTDYWMFTLPSSDGEKYLKLKPDTTYSWVMKGKATVAGSSLRAIIQDVPNYTFSRTLTIDTLEPKIVRSTFKTPKEEISGTNVNIYNYTKTGGVKFEWLMIWEGEVNNIDYYIPSPKDSFDDAYPKYEGYYSSFNPVQSQDYRDYLWSRILGGEGKEGNGVKASLVMYSKSTSGTIAPKDGWSATIPVVGENEYLWTRTTLQYDNGETTIAYSVSKTGSKGKDGDKGDPGDKGPDGRTSYFHTGWANSPDGSEDFTSEYPNANLISRDLYYLNSINTLNESDFGFTTSGWASPIFNNNSVRKIFEPGKRYYVTYDVELLEKVPNTKSYSQDAHGSLLLYAANVKPSHKLGTWSGNTATDFDSMKVGDVRTRRNFIDIPDYIYDAGVNYNILCYGNRLMNSDGTLNSVAKVRFFNFKIEEIKSTVNKGTIYLPSPKDDPSRYPMKYIGTYTDFTELDSTDYKKYAWSRFLGETSLVNYAWSNSPDGFLDFTTDSPTVNLFSVREFNLKKVPTAKYGDIRQYEIKGKPNTVYRVETKAVFDTANASIFTWTDGDPVKVPETPVNGVKEGAFRNVTTNSTGILYIAIRDKTIFNMTDKWVLVTEGKSKKNYMPSEIDDQDRARYRYLGTHSTSDPIPSQNPNSYRWTKVSYDDQTVIGGRNLLLPEHIFIQGTPANISSSELGFYSTNLVSNTDNLFVKISNEDGTYFSDENIGEKKTISFKYQMNEGKVVSIGGEIPALENYKVYIDDLFVSDDLVKNPIPINTDKQIHKIAITGTVRDIKNIQTGGDILIKPNLKEGFPHKYNIILSDFQIEDGDKATGFAPNPLLSMTKDEWDIAQKELEDKINNKADEEDMMALQELLEQLKNSYEAFVSDGGKYEEDLKKMEERTVGMLTTLGDQVAMFEFLTTYIRLGEEGLVIGKEDDPMQVMLGKDRLSFMDGGKEVAYFSNQSFYINRGAIVDSLQIGVHKFSRYGNKGTVVQYVGGT